MKREDVVARLRQCGVQPSAQRVAVAEYVLSTADHPSAEEVWARVRGGLPQLSRATVYNTLNLLERKGLLRQLVLAEGRVVCDPNLVPHHHFIDDADGSIVDVPWAALRVKDVERLHDYQVREYSVVMRGRRRKQAVKRLSR
jgi:Fe2+ or Zn2+ uptake regulation protein